MSEGQAGREGKERKDVVAGDHGISANLIHLIAPALPSASLLLFASASGLRPQLAQSARWHNARESAEIGNDDN